MDKLFHVYNKPGASVQVMEEHSISCREEEENWT